MREVMRAAAVGVIALLVWQAAVAAKPDAAPVRVEFERTPAVRVGDQATTVLTFRALADIERLDVMLAPFKGVEIVSQPTQATFTAMKENEGRQLSVTVRMTGDRYGYLSVTYRVKQGDSLSAGATTVIYSTPE